jgi:peptide/nickel transport system substrate-binding protein
MRKTFLTALSLVILASMVLASCAAPTPAAPQSPVIQTQIVEKPVIQTQVVEVTAAAPAAPAVNTFPREETLYTGGKQWGPVSSWNPFQTGSYAMGVIGLVYETPFIYDPLKDEFKPWLAESGSWTDASTYVLKLRQGLTWSDGQPLNADDVKFTFDVGNPKGKGTTLNFSGVWSMLTSVDKVDDLTVKFSFSNPLYQEWANYMYNTPIVPQHLWATKDLKDVATGANEKPVGSGPYLFQSVDQTKQVWARNDTWWGIKALSLSMAPKYIIDLVNSSNENALGLTLQGQEDLNNNYLPSISNLLNGGYAIHTYYAQAPYHLPANTAVLDINLQKAPMNDVKFRQAMAYAINVDDIVSRDYGNMVQKADPSGLLPVWDKYIDKAQVAQLGWKYDAAKAKSLLAAAGYTKKGSDGFLQNKDGSPIALKLIVPNGWSDWMTADQIIAKNLQDVGINVQPDYPDYNGYMDQRLKGTFDLAIDNNDQISNTPWSYYNFMFYSDLANVATVNVGNYGRYDNKEAFDLVQQLDKTPVDKLADMQAITSKLQKISMTDLPIIPLWYNGAWAQFNSTYWTGWPSGEKGPNYFPVTWNGYWNMTSILMLANLKPAPKP